jgi:S-DNA-T family DNA segregation ATPase FtsK/SpoIIIE
MVLETGQASVSLLQRKFRIGYTRAARLVDMMEEMKIVSVANGSKPREIIMNSDQIYSRYFQKS